VDNLLAYARITDVTEVYSFEELSLATVIFEALKRFDATLTQRGFEVRTDIAADLPDVHADHTAMELLLDNLIDNAIRYSSTTRRLTIRTRDSSDMCTIEIADSGDGIPADQIKNVTRRFYRGAHAVSGGSGLGLAIANRIAVDHGGRLTIASEVGRGTTVTVVLPRHQKST
jgi:two-component system phosphate regulon sensor histidine kinase PhoR